MKTLLAIIITATLSFGCAILESEQTTTDSGGGGTTSAPSPSTSIANTSWTKQFGTYGDDSGYDISTDTDGNLYVVGTTRSDRDGLNYNNLFNPSFDYLFVKKFNHNGELQWTSKIEITSSNYQNGPQSYSLVTDSDNNVYVTGPNNGNFNGSPVSNGLFLIKYNSDGLGKWIKHVSYSGSSYNYSSNYGNSDLTVDSKKNIYLTFYSSSYSSVNYSTIYSPVIVKFDPSGNELLNWQTNHTNNSGCGSYYDNSYKLTTDNNDNILITSSSTNSCGSSNQYQYISKYYDNGTEQWTQQLQTKPNNSCGGYYGEIGTGGVASDSFGNVYITGTGDLDNNSSAYTSCGPESQDVYLAKYSDNGTFLWSDQIGSKYYNSEGYDNSVGITVGISDEIYITGTTDGAFDGNTNSGGREVFVAKYDKTGQKNWVKQFGTSADDRSLNVTADNAGNSYIIGSTNADLDGNKNSGGYDVFIAKFDKYGSKK